MKNEKGKLISQSLITRVPNYRVNPILILLWIKFCTMNDSRNCCHKFCWKFLSNDPINSDVEQEYRVIYLHYYNQ